MFLVVGVLVVGCGDSGMGELGDDVVVDVVNDIKEDVGFFEEVVKPDVDVILFCENVVCFESMDLCVLLVSCDFVIGVCTNVVLVEAGIECDVDGDSCMYDVCDGMGICMDMNEINIC